MKHPLFILCAAGRGLMIDSQIPILLTKFADGEFLYQKQINSIYSQYPQAIIIYITGFFSEKIDAKLESLNCHVVNNENYEHTSSAHSLYLATKIIRGHDGAFILNGNLFFTSKTIKSLVNNIKNPDDSLLFVNNNFSEKGLGIGPNGLLDWSFKDKWTKVCYLSKGDLELFNHVNQNLGPKLLLFEIINKLNTITNLKVVKLEEYIKEISRVKDIKIINKDFFHE